MHTRVVYGSPIHVRSNAFRPYFLDFLADNVSAQVALYLQSQACDHSQTSREVSPKVGLMKYSDIRRKSHMPGFVIDGHICCHK